MCLFVCMKVILYIVRILKREQTTARRRHDTTLEHVLRQLTS